MAVQEKSNVTSKKGFGDIIRDNIQKLIIVIVSALYIAQGLFEIVKNDTTLLDVLGSIALNIAVGLIISTSLSDMGLKDGRNSEIFQNSIKSYGEAKIAATPNFDKLSSWCDYKNAQNLEEKRKDIIQSAGLNWKAYKLGYYKEHTDKLSKDQLKSLEKAKSCTVPKINSKELLSDFPRTRFSDKKEFGESEQDYKNRNFASEFLSKVGLGVICGLYMLQPILTEDVLAGVIWNTSKIIMWISFGMTKYFSSKSFMENEYRQTHIILKTEYLTEFTITLKNNPSAIQNSEESQSIDAYIDELIKERESKNE